MIKIPREFEKKFRRFTRKAIQYSPQAWRDKLYRKHVKLSYELPPNLTVKLAETQEELEKAYSLVHDSYIEMGYMDPHNSGMRLGFYNMLPFTSTVIALWDDEVIGTFSIVLDNPAKLPIENDFEMTYLKRKHSRIAEIIGLTVKKDFRSAHGSILFPLLKYLYNFSSHYLGIDCLVIAVSPIHAELYKSVILFSEIEDKVIEDPLVKGAPMKGLYLDLDVCPSEYKSVYDHQPDDKNLYKYMRQLKLPNLVYPKKEYYHVSYSAMSPPLIKYFFKKKSNIIGTLTRKQKEVLNYDIFLDGQFEEFFTAGNEASLRGPKKGMCYPTFCKGQVSSTEQYVGKAVNSPIRILDVSENGLYGSINEKLELRKQYKIAVQISPVLRIHLLAKVIWRQGDRIFGFHILDKDQSWDDFIHHMEKKYYKTYDQRITKKKRAVDGRKVS